MKRLLVSVAALALMSGAALAADMPMEPEAVVAPVPVASDWSGFYVGVQGGYAWGTADYDFDASLFAVPDSTVSDSSSFDVNGFAGGVYAGSNFQRGNWVFGLDSSFSLTSIEGDDSFGGGDGSPIEGGVDVHSEIDWFSTTRGRIGYAFGDFMVFAAGGAAMGQSKMSIDVGAIENPPIVLDAPLVLGGKSDDTEYHLGWTAGAGVEAKFWEHWTARAEYLYVDLGEEDFDLDVSGIAIKSKTDLNFNLVRGGIAYHF